MPESLCVQPPINLDECIRAYQEIVAKFGFIPVIQPGRMQLLGWDLEYVCGATLASFIDSTLVRRLNDFIPDNDHPLILDCGANIGFTVLNYKRQFPKARIIAFEPDPQFVPYLRRNLERNGAADVQVIEAAAWIGDGQAEWFCDGDDGSHIVEPGAKSVHTVTVQTVDLAAYLTEPIDLLKVDIEGAEYQVVHHLGQRLQNVKNIVIECHFDQDQVLPLARMLEALAAAGFKLGVNSYGAWRDLLRQPLLATSAWKQYLLIAGWRGEIPLAIAEPSALPYTGIQAELELRNHRAEAQAARQALETMQIAMHARETDFAAHAADLAARESELATRKSELAARAADLAARESDLAARKSELAARESELAARERQLLQSICTYYVSGRQALESRALTPPFAGQGKLGWTVHLHDLAPGADDEQNPTHSSLLLFENDTPLGPAHALHDDIRNVGGGRFSHWSTDLYFSTSDNSDPNTNGRTYTIVFVNAGRASVLAARARELDAREKVIAEREASAVQLETVLTQRAAELAGRETES